MQIADLTIDDVSCRLRGDGLVLRTGPFVTRLRTRFVDVARSVHFLYAHHEVDDAAPFADFHVGLTLPRGPRRFVRRQVLFFVDGRQPFLPFPRHLAVPLLEWGLNWCIACIANQYLIVHAASLARDGRAVIMPGKPGAGKSTLCTALAHRGWRLMSDEFALIRPVDGLIVPLTRPISLKNQSIDVVRGFVADAPMDTVWSDTRKGSVAHMRPPADCVALACDPATPAWIVFPRWRTGTAPRFEPMLKSHALLQLADNCMNYSIQGRRGFNLVADVVEQSVCHTFEYESLDDAVDAFAQL